MQLLHCCTVVLGVVCGRWEELFWSLLLSGVCLYCSAIGPGCDVSVFLQIRLDWALDPKWTIRVQILVLC